MKSKRPQKNKFRDAVEATPDVSACYRSGLQALGRYSAHIRVSDTSKIDGSIDIDGCTTALYPQSNRWDFALGYRGRVYFVEVHSAHTGEVSTVLRKLQWIKDWLVARAPHINALKAPNAAFFWIQSKGFAIPKNTPQYRAAVARKILPISDLELY